MYVAPLETKIYVEKLDFLLFNFCLTHALSAKDIGNYSKNKHGVNMKEPGSFQWRKKIRNGLKPEAK